MFSTVSSTNAEKTNDAAKTRIIIQNVDETAFILSVDPSDSVMKLKELIGEKKKIYVYQYYLVFNGIKLENKKPLSDYGIQNDSFIKMVSNLSQNIQLSVLNNAGKTFWINVNENESIKCLQNRIQNECDIPLKEQCFTCFDEQTLYNNALENGVNDFLNSYGIDNDLDYGDENKVPFIPIDESVILFDGTEEYEKEDDSSNNEQEFAGCDEELDYSESDNEGTENSDSEELALSSDEEIPPGEEFDSKENEMPIPMQSSLVSTSNQSNIIRAPNYRLITEYRGNWVKHLYIFNSDDKTLCYNYTLTCSKNYFVCRRCKQTNRTVSATLVSNENGEEYVKLNKKEHACQRQKFKTQTIIYEPNFKLNTVEYRSKKILQVFDSNDKTLYYSYAWYNSIKAYRCNSCVHHRVHVTAHLAIDENGKECCVLSAQKHDPQCKPKKAAK